MKTLFPRELPVVLIKTGQEYQAAMNEQGDQLNSLEAGRFEPALTALDDLVGSIQIETP
jgi:hypothetical protein